MKICRKCKIEQEELCFYRTKTGFLRNECKKCVNEYNKRFRLINKDKIKEYKNSRKSIDASRKKVYDQQRRESDPRLQIFDASKERAKKSGIEHSIQLEDIVVPTICPVLNIKIVLTNKKRSYNSPSLDRIDNSKGYTKDNIIVISWRANELKRNATIDEMKMLAEFYRKYQ